MKSNKSLLFSHKVNFSFYAETYAHLILILFFLIISTICKSQQVDLSLEKALVQSSTMAGGLLIFETKIKNEGTLTVKSIKIKDIKPSSTQFVSAIPANAYNPFSGLWQIDSIASGQTIVLQYRLLILEEGVITSEAEVFSHAGIDIDSSPNNGNWSEDDWSSACASVPYQYCSASAIRLAASAPDGLSHYEWYKDGTLVATTQELLITAFGSYSYKAKLSGTACELSSCCPIIVEPSNKSIILHPTVTQTCGFEDKATISVFAEFGTTPIQYVWSNGATTQRIENLVNGVYSVTVTDAIGCSASDSYQVNQCCNVTYAGRIGYDETSTQGSFDPAPIVEIEPVQGGVGTIKYVWLQSIDGNNWTTIPFATGKTYDPPVINQTTYYRRCIQVTGCGIILEGNIIIKAVLPNVPCTLAHSLTKTDINCQNTKGSLVATVVGGTLPYTYLWSNGASTSSLTNLNAGYYELTITDSKGCKSICGLKILNLSSIFTINKSCTGVSCNGGNDGTAKVWVVSGGKAPFTYKWSNGAIISSVSYLTAGTYSVTVTDANGCTKTTSVVIPQSKAIVISMVKKEASCYGLNDATITTAVSGGTSPYKYLWNNASTVANLTGLSSGAYILTVTDAKNCIGVKNITINAISDISLNTTSKNVTCNGASNGSATVIVSGGTKPYTYLWSNGIASNVTKSLIAGLYQVTVRDAKGCKKYASVTISEPSGLSVTSQAVTNCINGIRLVAAGGTPPYRYSKDGKVYQTNPILCNLPNGLHTVMVKDASGCIKALSVVIGSTTNATSRGMAEITEHEITKQLGVDNFPQLKLFPNPSEGELNLRVEGIELSGAKITITDLLGRVVEERKISDSPATLYQMDVRHFAAGTYMITLTTNDNQQYQEQFLVLKN